MPYTVQFVGLVCFYREKGGRQALLPDGRNPGSGIDPHFASIVVAPSAMEDATGWNGDSGAVSGTFALPPSMVTLEGVDQPGTLDTGKHDDRLPQLRGMDPNFEIDPERADTIARLRIRQGKLTVFKIRGGSALISQLDVPHDGPIHITVTPRDGSPERTILLRPGTEIAIANTSGKRSPGRDQERGHFRIYERLSVRPVSLAAPVKTPRTEISESRSHHPIFAGVKAINLTINCSNTGCC